MTTTEPARDPQGTGERATVNGIELYYEMHGSGRPLVLLHGGLASGESYAAVLPALAAEHRVVLVDLQGHGRTADVDRPIDHRIMADDIAALIDKVGASMAPDVDYSDLVRGLRVPTLIMAADADMAGRDGPTGWSMPGMPVSRPDVSPTVQPVGPPGWTHPQEM